MSARYVFEVVVEPAGYPHREGQWRGFLSLEGEELRDVVESTPEDVLAALVRLHWSEARDLLAEVTCRECGEVVPEGERSDDRMCSTCIAWEASQ